jgi:hypothetical protein
MMVHRSWMLLHGSKTIQPPATCYVSFLVRLNTNLLIQ